MVGYGYNTISSTSGSLTDTTFELGGNAYTITEIGIDRTRELPELGHFPSRPRWGRRSTSSLKLHVCDANFEFSSAAHTVTATGESTYQWASTGLDWSTVTTRRLYLSTVDTRAPVLVRTTVNGPTLTMTYDEPLKVTSPTKVFDTATSSRYRATKPDQKFEVSDIEAGVGPGGQNVTMTIYASGTSR